MKLGGVEGYLERMWQVLGFLARYGHQPVDVCLSQPRTSLNRLCGSIAKLMREEHAPLKGPGDV